MLKLIMLRGLPASGKSTWAKEQTKDKTNIIRVNNDDIRKMFNNGKFTKDIEDVVTAVRNINISHALSNGISVIVDNTNLNPIHEEQLRSIADTYKCSFEVKDFKTTADECIRRDHLRGENAVGAQVIAEMSYKYNYGLKEPKFAPVQMDIRNQHVFIFDIDGTLAEKHESRGFHDYDKVALDYPITRVMKMRDILELARCKVIYVSGRKSSCEEDTFKWIQKHHPVGDFYAPELYMRKSDDNRSDDIVKREILDELIKKYYIDGVFDDRNRVVDMWRQSGLQCYQVNYGDF